MSARFHAVVLPGALFVAVAASPHPAAAQGTSVDAEELFKQGRAALDAGDFAVACEKLGASNRIERAVGTLMSLAKCEEATGKLARAREHWQEAGDLADASNDRLQRGPGCRDRFAEIDQRVPRLTVHLAATAPKDAVVKRDGVALVAAALDTALPVDPGAHTLEVSAPGHEPRNVHVDLAEGQARVIEVSPGVATTVEGTSAAHRSGGMGPLFWSGLGVAGAGLIVGIAAGAAAVSNASSLASVCTNHDCYTPNAQSAYSAAKATSLASDIGFAVAGAGAVVAGVGFFLHRRAAREPPVASMWIGPGSAGVRGAF